MPSRSPRCVKCGDVVNDGAAVMRAAASSPADLASALVCGRCSGRGADTAEGRAASMRRAADVDASAGSTDFWAGVILERDLARDRGGRKVPAEKARKLAEMARAREAAEHRAKVARAEAAGIGGWDRR